MSETGPVVVVEDDPFLRIVQLVLDPAAAEKRFAAFAEFFSHDLPDFSGWLAMLRQRLGRLYPAKIRLVTSQEELMESVANARAVIVEGFEVGAAELAAAPLLRAVQKFGTIAANIDSAACHARGVRVLTLRRRANMACAEHALGLMLAFARKICTTNGLISAARLKNAGYSPGVFDRAHTANSNWARITGIRNLCGSTLGIVGLGEIGRELALRAAAFGMEICYTQRHRLSAGEEARYRASHLPLPELLARSDYVSLHLPGNPQTHGIIGRRELEAMKRGAVLVNVSRADLVDRPALLEALRAGHLGGFVSDLPYEEPGRDDDPLLQFGNVILTPHIAAQPRFNALDDLAELLVNLNEALR